MYTMQDLVSVNSGKLLEELSGLTATFGKHIKFDCPVSCDVHLKLIVFL